MNRATTQSLVQEAQRAGYQVLSAEQLRQNRWLLQLLDGHGASMLLMVQARPLVGASDVQDLAELVRLRRPRHGILLAYQGSFSPTAQRTLTELGNHRLRLCTALPQADVAEAPDARPVSAALKMPL